MSAVRIPALPAVRLSHGAVVVLAFVLVMAVAVVGVVTGATGAKGEQTAAQVTISSTEPVDMYTAMADIAAALAALPPPPPTTVEAVRQVQTRPAVVVDPSDPGVWDTLAQCETGGNWATDSVSGFSGGLGFAHGTWASNGGTEFAEVAADATREQQIEVAQRVLEGSGWGAWPGCSDLLGLR
jgi:hypothetical protein